MQTTAPVIPALPASASATPIVGGPKVLEASLEIANAAQHTLDVDTFRPTRTQNLDAFAAAKDRGVDVRLRLDTDSLKDNPTDTARLGAVTEYGTNPYKQHAKAISRDGTEALVATDVSDVKSEPRMEFGIRFGGAAAKAFEGVQRLAPDSPPAAVQDAMDAARTLGVYANDPRNGRRDVSAALRTLVGSATDELWVASKLFDSNKIADDLVAAAARGVKTTLVTHDIQDEHRQQLTQGGVDVQYIPYANAFDKTSALHGTIVATNGVALLTSMPLKKGAIDGTKGRQSREFGVGLDGDVAANLVSEVRARLDAIPR